MKSVLQVCFIVVTLAANSALNAQISTVILDSLMLSKSYEKANENLELQISYLRQNGLQDSLYKYPYYKGRIAYLGGVEAEAAVTLAEEFTESIINESNNKRLHYKSLLSLSSFYDELGKNNLSLKATQRALAILNKIKDASQAEFGRVKYNLGATFLSLGEIADAKANFLDALEAYEFDENTLTSQLGDAYNAVGASMWLTSELDSAAYYYSKAVQTIKKTKGDPIENLYLATVVRSNISLLDYSQGKLNNAIENHKAVIADYEKVIKTSVDENIVSKARSYQLDAITNLSVFYNEIGHIQNSLDLLQYAYEKRKQMSEPGDADLVTSNIQIGQAYLSLMEFDKSQSVLKEALKELDSFNIENPYWRAAAWHAMAEAEIGLGDFSAASLAFKKGQMFFKKTLDDEYDTEYINFLKHHALFLASQGSFDEAIALATSAYEVCKNSAIDNLAEIKLALVLAQINDLKKDLDTSELWYRQVEKIINDELVISQTKSDSIQASIFLPKVMVGLSKLSLKKNPNEALLQEVLDRLNRAVRALEQRKASVYKNEDVALLIEDYRSVAELSKTASLKLYELTGKNEYLDKILNYHESSIYNRIRLRMNLKNNISFKDIPETIIRREELLKEQLLEALSLTGDFSQYLDAEGAWQDFLDTLKSKFPKYFHMRYAQIEVDLNKVQQRLENATLIRYLTIDNDLYAYVIDLDFKHFVKLDNTGVVETIRRLQRNTVNNSVNLEDLNFLYLKLWQPIKAYLKTKRVILVPDGELFNLSFEMLTSIPINGYEAFKNNSLLSQHIISYNYSSLLVDANREPQAYQKNFVAFSPEFDDYMKADYLAAISDSLVVDKTYLKLLPQPFSKNLAQTYSEVFDGESFLNEKASKRIFTSQAKEHKIIHIGTHAETNNLSPELSRLIFAKEISQDGDLSSNSLYTYEIYDQNLSSNLAILTACETGKPSYSAGEGMISLAHAFSYAGSESILTSLWKIDEKSSMQILDNFYQYLRQNMPKDEALQKAKLDYLDTSEGRLQSPQYWAGLVILGDVKPLNLETSEFKWVWLVVFLLALFVFGLTKFTTKKD
jgi:CHAT domain-containing protein